MAKAAASGTSKASSPRGGGYDPVRTRAALLESALDLFGNKGFAGTSLDEITSRAGVTKGAFYHHFQSKEDLLRLIHDEFVDYELVAMRRTLASTNDPAEQLVELLREFMRSVELYRDNVRVFFQERRYLTGDRFAAVKAKRDEFDQMFYGVIRRGVEQGMFRRDIDPRVASFGILGMCGWSHHWFEPGGRQTSTQVADVFAEMVLAGLRAD